jgi:hypothetical protein
LSGEPGPEPRLKSWSSRAVFGEIIRYVGFVARKVQASNTFITLIGTSEGRKRFWGIGINGIILLKWALK